MVSQDENKISLFYQIIFTCKICLHNLRDWGPFILIYTWLLSKQIVKPTTHTTEKNPISKENSRPSLKKICCISKGKKNDSILLIYTCISSTEISYMYTSLLLVNSSLCITKGYKILQNLNKYIWILRLRAFTKQE